MERLSLVIFSLWIFANSFLSQKPNIVLILVDDQDETSLGCYGGNALTPNIDRLADEGTKFNRAYSASSVCGPSRYALLSGRHPGKNLSEEFSERYPQGGPVRLENINMVLESNIANLPNILQQNGYKTGMIGKWHIGTHFHHNNSLWESFGLQTYDQDANPSNPSVMSSLLHNHTWYENAIKPTGFDFADNIYWANLRELFSTPLNYHNINWSTEGALRFIDENKDDPFFLFFSTTLLHGPTPQRSFDNDAAMNVTSKGIINFVDPLPSRDNVRNRVAQAGFAGNTEQYTWLDDAVGAIHGKLEDLNIDDNTIIIYLADHNIAAKSSVYEGGIKIPMIFWMPNKIAQGYESERLVQSIDIAPTLLDLADIDLPNNWPHDGKSVRPILEGKDTAVHNSLYFEIGYARGVLTETDKLITYREPDNKQDLPIYFQGDYYIWNSDLGMRAAATNSNYFTPNQIYNIIDTDESNNIYNSVSQQKRDELHELLAGYLAQMPGRPYGNLSSVSSMTGFVEGDAGEVVSLDLSNIISALNELKLGIVTDPNIVQVELQQNQLLIQMISEGTSEIWISNITGENEVISYKISVLVNAANTSSPMLVHNWMFNGTLNDTISDAHAQIKPDSSFSYNSDRIRGKSSIELKDSSWLSVNHQSLKSAFSERSISLWFRSKQTSNKSYLYEEGGTQTGISIFLENDSINVNLRKNGGAILDLKRGDLINNQWNHVVLTYDNGTVMLYLNGNHAEEILNTNFGIFPEHLNPGAIGGVNYASLNVTTNHPFQGKIDDVRIYDVRALSSAQVDSIYQSFVPPFTYELFVNNGQGSGFYAFDEQISIKADSADFGFTFSHWGGDNQTMVDTTMLEATLYMLEEEMSIEPVYVEDITTDVISHSHTDIKFYPNPNNTGILNIQLTNSFLGGRLSILDITGSKISELTIDKQNFDLTLPEIPGIYLIKVDGISQHLVEKLIVE